MSMGNQMERDEDDDKECKFDLSVDYTAVMAAAKRKKDKFQKHDWNLNKHFKEKDARRTIKSFAMKKKEGKKILDTQIK